MLQTLLTLQDLPHKVSRWVQYAASKNVQRLTLCQCPQNIEIPPRAALFSCGSLTTLQLSNYNLTNIPNGFIWYKNLISCSFSNIEFTDESLALFISRCPVLQELAINPSVGLLKPVISGAHIRDIVINDNHVEVLTIKCPKLVTLIPEKINVLRVNGVFFQELSHGVRNVTMECENRLVELSLILELDEDAPNVSAERVLEIVSEFKSLKKLSIDLWGRLPRENAEMTVPLFKILERHPNLEFLSMAGLFAVVRQNWTMITLWCLYRGKCHHCILDRIYIVKFIYFYF